MVWELWEELKTRGKAVPIIGMGGINCTEDALEFLMAGAAAVQIGSATFAHPATMTEIIDGIGTYMQREKISKLEELGIR
jgi:dihydroorotate dehydrogenase (NAD+) catalytic subunit